LGKHKTLLKSAFSSIFFRNEWLRQRKREEAINFQVEQAQQLPVVEKRENAQVIK